jgi:hypothetical protein
MRALREYVENQLAAIDHADLEFVFQIARLRGAERVVENRERCALRSCQLAHFSRFAFADKSAWVGSFQALANDPGDFRAGAFGQGFEFVERFFAADSCFGTEFDPDQNGAFVMLVGDVVGLCQIFTSIAENLRFHPIRYWRSPVRRVPARF